MVGLSLGQLVIGPISDWTGRRRPLLIGLLLYATTSLLCGWAGSIEILICLRLAQGFAAAIAIVLSRAIVRDLYAGDKLVRVFATMMIALGGGPIVAPIAGAQLLRVTDWRGTFLALAAVALVLVGVVALLLPETLPRAGRRSGSARAIVHDLKAVATERVFALCAITVALTAAAFFTYLAISPFVLQGLFGLSPQGFSAAFAVNAAGFVVGGQANRPLIRWLSTEQRLLTGVGIILTGGLSLLLAALFTVPPLALVLLAFFAVASGYGLTSPNCAALAMTGNRERAGTASALFGLSLYGLGSVVAPISGLLAASLVPTAATITTLAAAASVTTLLLLIQRRRTVRRSLRFQATSRTTSNSP